MGHRKKEAIEMKSVKRGAPAAWPVDPPKSWQDVRNRGRGPDIRACPGPRHGAGADWGAEIKGFHLGPARPCEASWVLTVPAREGSLVQSSEDGLVRSSETLWRDTDREKPAEEAQVCPGQGNLPASRRCVLSREGVDGAGPSKGPGAGSLEAQEGAGQHSCLWAAGGWWPEGHSRVQLFPMLCLRGNRARR